MPRFFLDRSLGRIAVPSALRADGWDVVTLAEHYGIPQDEEVTDVEWLELAGRNGWAVVMKDERIRYRTVERGALIRHGVRAICLTSGNLAGAAMADLLIVRRLEIEAAVAGDGPALFALSQQGLREIALD